MLTLIGTPTQWRLEDSTTLSTHTLLTFEHPHSLTQALQALEIWLQTQHLKHLKNKKLALKLDPLWIHTESFQLPKQPHPPTDQALWQLLQKPFQHRLGSEASHNLKNLYWDFIQSPLDHGLEIKIYFLESSLITPLLSQLSAAGFPIIKLTPLNSQHITHNFNQTFNLLPWRETQEKQEVQRFWGLILIGSMIGFLIWVPVKILKHHHIVKQETQLRSQQKASEQEQTRLLQARQALQTQQQRLQDQRSLLLKTQQWQTYYRQLKDLAELQPQSLTLTQIHVQDQHWEITGIARDRESVLVWQQALQDTQVFSTLQLTALTPLAHSTDVQFELTALSPPARAQAQTGTGIPA